MPYDILLANRVRAYLANQLHLPITEKKMFGGLAFLVKEKMCVNVSADNLMCRFNPALEEELSHKNGYIPLFMRGKRLKGYCYVDGTYLTSAEELTFWIDICLAFSEQVPSTNPRPPRT